jgi:hypothetical protein
MAALVEVLIVKLFEVFAFMVNFVQVFLDVPLVLWLLEGCRVRVAARAPPLQ